MLEIFVVVICGMILSCVFLWGWSKFNKILNGDSPGEFYNDVLGADSDD